MAKHVIWCLKRTFLLANRWKIYQQPVLQVKTNNVAIHSRGIANFCGTRRNLDYDEPTNFSEFADELGENSTVAITTLMTILSVTNANAKKAVHEYPIFKMLPKKTIYKNFQCLLEGGFSKSTIIENKYLLTDETETLKKKIIIVQNIDVDINDAAPLFQLSAVDLENFERLIKPEANHLPICNKIMYLAEKLQCDIAKICNILCYNPFLMKLPAPQLSTITEYLLEVGMKPEHILNDLSIYNYNIGRIKYKIERARKAGIDPLKPWIVTCQKTILKKMQRKQAKREAILKPGQSVVEYIRDIFDCELEQVDYIVKKNPRILVKNLEKLSTILTFFKRKGYKIEDIQRAPTVIYRSFSTISKRCEAWEKAFKKKPPLFVLDVSAPEFVKLLEKSGSTDEEKKPS